ncbi:MAG TPA: mechanosensitive ion channel [Spirochaetota bacterium]|nr:mechanosensitive ion channel [Spirochaetota bacterium]
MDNIISNLTQNIEFGHRIAAAAILIFLSTGLYFITLIILSKISRRIETKTKPRSTNKSASRSIKLDLKRNSLILLLKEAKIFSAIVFLFVFISLTIKVFPEIESFRFYRNTASFFYLILSITIAFRLYKTIKITSDFLYNSIPALKGGIIRSVHIKNMTLLSEDKIISAAQKTVRFFRLFLTLLMLYIFIPITFSFFEFTQTWADTLFGYIADPIKSAGSAAISFIPNMFFIAAMIFISRYIVKLAAVFFGEIEKGNLGFSNFHKDWANPTFKIVKILIVMFTLIIIFPYLPGSQSEAFKGVSIFAGILLSLGSTSIVSNIISGVILTYTSAFRIGDRVKIGETTGDILEKTLLVTRIRTIKNIIITIPNSIVMNSHIENYTTSACSGEGLILNTSITLGYDIPWRKIHEVLTDAALSVKDIMKKPRPFILQTALNDFYVNYELNCYTDKPEKTAVIYSTLHQAIQDKCAENGIEIMSPHYSALRNGGKSTIPKIRKIRK